MTSETTNPAKALAEIKAKHAKRLFDSTDGDILREAIDEAVSISRASQGSGTEERDARISRIEGLLQRVLAANIARAGEHSRIPLVKDIQHALAAAPTAALSPPATPQVTEDVRERALRAIDSTSGPYAIVGALDRAHLLNTPVTVTRANLETMAAKLRMIVSVDELAGAMEMAFGGRIRMAGSEGPK